MKKKKAASPLWVFIQENYLGGMDWQDLASKMGGGQLRKIIVDPKKKKMLPRSSNTGWGKVEGRQGGERENSAFFWGGGGNFRGNTPVPSPLQSDTTKERTPAPTKEQNTPPTTENTRH